jgi:hypothetical protein
VHAYVSSAAAARDTAAAAIADRAQDVGAPIRSGSGVVGEDVVDLVAAPAGAQAADVRALAVAILELGLRLRVRLGVLLGLVFIDVVFG